MRRYIDGHVHINPIHEVGWVDPLTGDKELGDGLIEDKNGVVGRFTPAFLHNGWFPVEQLIATMDENNVEKAVVMAHLSGDICETAYDAFSRYPNRLRTAISVVPDDEGVKRLEYWNEKGISILKCEMRSMNEFLGRVDIDEPRMLKLFKKAEELKMTVVIDPSPSTFPSYQPEGTERVLDACPDLQMVICHMGFPFKGMRNNSDIYKKWLKMTSLAARDNVHFDVTAIPDLFAEENFPWPSAMEFLNEFVSRYGVNKAIWGTDIPGTFRNATYTQMKVAFERCEFLTEDDKDKLFYRNADEVYFSKK